MDKLKGLINKAIKEGDRRYFDSVYKIREAMRIYDEIEKSGKTITISSDIVKICKNCGLKVGTHGIGYLISR